MPGPLVALDVSASWLRGGDTSAWRRARDQYQRLGEGLLVGDSVVSGGSAPTPTAGRADMQSAVDRAAAEGRPVVLITDGEILGGGIDRSRAPAGSRIDVIRPHRGSDVAIAQMTAPVSTPEGDTMSVLLSVSADESGSSGGRVEIAVDGRQWGAADIPPLARFGSAEVSVRGRMPPGRGQARLTAIARTTGDSEPRNDTARAGVARAPVVSAVFVSSSPDFDARFAAAALKETVSLPTRTFYQVAPGSWRTGEGQAVTRDAVLFAAIRAPLLTLHGDTAHFGPPRRVFTGSLALMPTVRERSEWIADSGAASPIAPLLAEVTWDSLSPLAADPGPAGGSWVAMRASRSQADARAVVTGFDGDRRVVVVTGAGTYAWKLHGGVAAEAHAALWGGVFDWLVARSSASSDATPFRPLSSELLPTAPSVESSTFGSIAVAGESRRARDWPVLYALVVALLCAEWILRRRVGLR